MLGMRCPSRIRETVPTRDVRTKTDQFSALRAEVARGLQIGALQPSPEPKRSSSVLAHEATGEGEPLVLIHGLATTRVIWSRVLPLLGRSRRLIAIDVPGFGESPACGEGFELEAVADCIGDGLRELGVSEPYDVA